MRNTRLRKGLSQRGFAAQTGMSESYIALVERNKINPTFETILQCLRSIDLDLNYQTIEKDRSNDGVPGVKSQ